MHACISCLQDLKHLEFVNRHDLVYPEAFPGGLKGFVKKIFAEYVEQFMDESSEDEPAASSDKGFCFSSHVSHFRCDCI